jgi:hypothetical protein
VCSLAHAPLWQHELWRERARRAVAPTRALLRRPSPARRRCARRRRRRGAAARARSGRVLRRRRVALHLRVVGRVSAAVAADVLLLLLLATAATATATAITTRERIAHEPARVRHNVTPRRQLRAERHTHTHATRRGRNKRTQGRKPAGGGGEHVRMAARACRDSASTRRFCCDAARRLAGVVPSQPRS